MGAATVMMTSGEDLPSNVKVIIEDCGYSTVVDEFTYQLKSIPLAEVSCYECGKYSYKIKSWI